MRPRVLVGEAPGLFTGAQTRPRCDRLPGLPWPGAWPVRRCRCIASATGRALLSHVSLLGQAATRSPTKQKATRLGWPLLCEAPGSDLLSHGLSHTTIGADAFHFRVRDGIGWYHVAMSAREAVRPVAFARLASMGLGRNKASLSPAMCRRSHLELYDQAARIISIG